MTCNIVFTAKAREMLFGIKDRRLRDKIRERVNALSHDPEKQGDPLSEELTGYRSIRTVGQRYRIIYRVEQNKNIVSVVAVGIRKEGDKRDIYALAKKILRRRII